MAGGKGGRPPKFTSPEQMQDLIDAYFESCKGEPILDNDGMPLMDKWGNVILINQHPPTVTGLALALGFTSRQALLNYQAKRQFVDTILRAKARCEEYAESRLYDRDGANGAKFSLTYNFKWAQDAGKDGSESSDSGVVELPSVLPKPDTPDGGVIEDG